jgi:hypothetical protein
MDDGEVGIPVLVGSRIFFSSCRPGRSSSPGKGQEFSLLHVVQTGSGVHPTSYPMGTGGSIPEGKAAGAWNDHSPQTSAEVKKMWIYTSTPPYACDTALLSNLNAKPSHSTLLHPRSGGRSVSIVRLRTEATEIRLIFRLVTAVSTSNHTYDVWWRHYESQDCLHLANVLLSVGNGMQIVETDLFLFFSHVYFQFSWCTIYPVF